MKEDRQMLEEGDLLQSHVCCRELPLDGERAEMGT